ncbi:MAG: AarF/UbiB family protein [Clostridia bacterium]|nr:AarF/UbiB family protein [Clostridia bacterium]
MGNGSLNENRKRLVEILDVIRRHDILKGLSPEKLCAIIEDLGPTFIKLGQIPSMRSDILPKEYCESLKKLRGDVAPMPYGQVMEIIEKVYAKPVDEVFSDFDREALGSASIAQVHSAVLKTGQRVVVKVQREGIHEVMSRDIMLLKQACKLLKYTPVGDLVDFTQVLNEMWIVAQEEMNFQTEAANLEKFHKLNEKAAFISSPKLYRDYTTTRILVMERVEGMAIDDVQGLVDAGCDCNELGSRLAGNYVKQIIHDGFFHADPHPGNIRIRDGNIVWLDMGMMGSLSDGERKIIGKALMGVARGDIRACVDAVMALGEFHGAVDKRMLYRGVEEIFDKYASAGLGSMDLAKVFDDITRVMRENNISMPASLTMLARGLATIEGVLADLSPDINVLSVVKARLSGRFFEDMDLKDMIKRDAIAIYDSVNKSLEIPALLADMMRAGIKGEAGIGVEHHPGTDMARLLREIALKLSISAVASALIIAAGLLWQAEPKLGGISWYSAICFIAGICAFAAAFFKKNGRR